MMQNNKQTKTRKNESKKGNVESTVLLYDKERMEMELNNYQLAKYQTSKGAADCVE